MKQESLLIGLCALVLGFGAGYLMNAQPQQAPMSGMNHSMDQSMQGMMAGLEGKTGDAFDEAFLEEMVVHHEGAIEMARALRENTKRPELQKLAEDIITAQSGEIEMMKRWRSEWFQ